MNGVNWCEERTQRLEFRGGRPSVAVVVTAVAEQLTGKEEAKHFVVKNYLNNCMNPYILYPNWSFEKVAAETITFNPINAVQKATVAPFMAISMGHVVIKSCLHFICQAKQVNIPVHVTVLSFCSSIVGCRQRNIFVRRGTQIRENATSTEWG